MVTMITRAFEGMKRLLGGPDDARTQTDGGFTIIEVVMAAAILLTVVMSVMATVSFAATGSQQAQRRQAALNLASWRIEQAHTLPYASVGTTMGASLTGSPAGSLLAVETTGAYTINTTVRYAMDPATHLPTYKIVSVTVSWTTPIPGSVVVTTNIMGSETLTGASVLVNAVDLDDASIDVPGVLITLDPFGSSSNQQGTTDSDGNILFGSVPTGAITTITASCAGYLADLKPLKGSVVNAGANTWMLSMQQASSATIYVLLPDGTPIPGAAVGLTNSDLTHLSATWTSTKTVDASGTVYYPGLWEIKNAGYSYGVKITVPNNVGPSVFSTSFPMESGGLDKPFDIYPVNTGVTLTVTDQSQGWAVQSEIMSYVANGVPGTMTLLTDVNGQCTFYGIPTGTVVFNGTKSYGNGTTRVGTRSRTVVPGMNKFDIYTNLQ